MFVETGFGAIKGPRGGRTDVGEFGDDGENMVGEDESSDPSMTMGLYALPLLVLRLRRLYGAGRSSLESLVRCLYMDSLRFAKLRISVGVR